MAAVDGSPCDPEWQTTYFRLFVISLTINAIVALQLVSDACLRRLRRRKYRARLLAKHKEYPPGGSLQELIDTYPHQVSLIFVDALISFVLFGGALYLLIEGAVVNPFTLVAPPGCRFVSASALLFSAAVGRHCVAVVVGVRQMSLSTIPENVVSLVTLAVLLTSTEAMLTKTLLCLFFVDHSAANLSSLLDRLSLGGATGLVSGVRVIRCFLTLAFRLILPIVCLATSLSVSGDRLVDMETRAVALVVGCAVVFSYYNAVAVVTSLKDVWSAFSRRPDVDSGAHVSVNNQSTVGIKKAKLVFHANDFRSNDPERPTKLDVNRLLEGRQGAMYWRIARHAGGQFAYMEVEGNLGIHRKLRHCVVSGRGNPEKMAATNRRGKMNTGQRNLLETIKENAEE